MILINTTFHVHCAIARDFVTWLKEVYIPEATGHHLISAPVLCRVLGGDDPDGISYAMQLACPNLKEARQWHDNEGADLRARMLRRWGNKVLFFTTYLEKLDI